MKFIQILVKTESKQSQAKMFRLGHRDNKNENNLGHRDNKNADKMLGHRDTKNADRLGHRDIKNVEKIGFGFLRLDTQVCWFLSQNSWTCVDRQTDTKFLDMCGQTDKKILDMCGQTDTKILDIWDTGTLKMQKKND